MLIFKENIRFHTTSVATSVPDCSIPGKLCDDRVAVCRVSLFDYQAMCKNSHHHASSARPLLSVSPNAALVPVRCLLVPAGTRGASNVILKEKGT